MTRGAAKKERAAVERAGVAKVECGGNQIASGHRDDYVRAGRAEGAGRIKRIKRCSLCVLGR